MIRVFLLTLLFSVSALAQTKVDLAIQGALVPEGAVMAFARVSCPTGWLAADGSQVSRTTYSKLFAAVSTIHGTGNGTTTFHLPDYRGRFLRGVSGAATNDPDRLTRTAMNTGGNTGNAVGSVQGQATAKNGLAISDGGHSHALPNGTTNYYTYYGHVSIYRTSGYTGGSSALNTDGSTSNVSLGAGDNESRPVNAYVLYCVKY